MRIPLPVLFLACLLVVAAVSVPRAETQLQTPFMSTWVQASARYFKLDGDGSHALIQRMVQTKEEFVLITTDGKQEQVVYTTPGLGYLYYRFDLGADGRTMAFGSGSNRVFVVTSPGGPATSVAVPIPYAEPAQITLSKDGRWVACTAWRFQQQGSQYRRVDSLFVLATDGSAVYTITPQPFFSPFFPFAFSLDGRKIAWIDNNQQGPMFADRDGRNAIRLPWPPGTIPAQDYLRAVSIDPTASRLFYQMYSASALTLWEFDVATQAFVQLDSLPTTAAGWEVSRDGRRMRADLQTSSELLKENGRELMFLGSALKIAGSWAWSHDGNVFVWWDSASPYFNPVMLWKNSLGFGSWPPHRPGATVVLELRAPGRAGDTYQLGVSAATSPMIRDPLTGFILPLAADLMLLVSLQPCPLFHGFGGVLDGQGLAQASASVPADSRLVGLVFYAAYVTLQANRIQYVSDEVRIEIEM